VHPITAADIEYVKAVVLSLPASFAIGVDDAIGEGLVGLCKAAHSYDGRGRFLGYANGRIVGEVLDAARRADHVSRVRRDRIKSGDAENVPPPVHLEQLLADHEGLDLHSVIAEPDDEDIALRLTLDEALDSIEGRNGAMLRLWLRQGMPMRAIGEMFGISESRVSQVISDLRAELRETLAISAAELLG
jgi:RNA polymerase sigma factor (sigma-70 family)